jgi:diketogulonate reductase-like aldo/keto reductase
VSHLENAFLHIESLAMMPGRALIHPHTCLLEVARLSLTSTVSLKRGILTAVAAEMYGDGRSETLVGEAIEGIRGQVFMVTKILPPNAFARGTVKVCEARLKRFGVESIDLYLLQWRGRLALAETLEGLSQLREHGQIKACGVSNFNVADMEELFSRRMMEGAAR